MVTPNINPTRVMPVAQKLGAFAIWATGVGLVISGESFGWNIGWAKTGPLAFFIPLGLTVVLYYALVQTLIELACVYPEADGPSVYIQRAFGPFWAGFIAIAVLIEFLFASPAIAASVGEYICFLRGNTSDAPWIATGFLGLFCVVNLFDLRVGARVTIALTVLAILELILYATGSGPAFRPTQLLTSAYNRFDLRSLVEATPFAIWMLLGIEGISLMTRSVRENGFRRHLTIGYQGAFWTLVLLAVGVLLLAGGGISWTQQNWAIISQDNHPMPASLALMLPKTSIVVQLFTFIGLFGLIASLHAITLAATNQLDALLRLGWPGLGAGRRLATGLVFLVSTLAIWSSQTAFLIELSVFGAVCMYFGVAVSLLKIRTRPDHSATTELAHNAEESTQALRHADFAPRRSRLFAGIAASLSFVCILILSYLHPVVFGCFAGIALPAWLWHRSR
ncbi:MAG: amino acid permease [Spirosoma sp.]|nr:amino acid permease [Spirosoma sp.]